MGLLVFRRSAELVIAQGRGILNVHFHLVGGYGEDRQTCAGAAQGKAMALGRKETF